jgi:hypothetical protein
MSTTALTESGSSSGSTMVSVRARSASTPDTSSARGPLSQGPLAIASRSSARHRARSSSRPVSRSAAAPARSSGVGSQRRGSTKITSHTGRRSQSAFRESPLWEAAIGGLRRPRSRCALRGSIKSSRFYDHVWSSFSAASRSIVSGAGSRLMTPLVAPARMMALRTSRCRTRAVRHGG